jgi:hypothetical protein
LSEIEQQYTYQPTDEQGNAIGGRQVIKYKTVEELTQKLTEQNTLLIRKLRQETRNNRLGIIEEAAIEESVPRQRKSVRFEPKDLTPETRMQLARDITDPDRFDEVTDKLFEARIGSNPKDIADTLNELQISNQRLLGRIESDAFAAANPDYVKCQENAEAIVGWITRHKLECSRDNFQLAYDTLLKAGVLIVKTQEAPVFVPEPAPVVAGPDPVVPIVPIAEPVVPSRIPTALHSGNSSDEPDAIPVEGSDIVWDLTQDVKDTATGITTRRKIRSFTGLAAINAMPAEEYKRRLQTDPTFGKKVVALENAARTKRQP